MTGVLFAFGAAFSWATFTVLMRLALRGAPVIPATVILNCVNALVVSLLALLFHGLSPLGDLTRSALAVLSLGGFLHFSLSRPLYYGAIQDIGPSRAVPVATAYPFFTALLGALLLGEPTTLKVLAGVSLIVAGTALVFGGVPARAGGEGEGGEEDGERALRARLRGQVFAVLTCLMWGATAVLFKLGGRGLPALGAAAISLLVGSGGALLLWAFSRDPSRPSIPRRAWPFLLAAALFQSAAVPFYYAALARLEAATVATVNSTQPLLSLALAFLFLREMERITRRVVGGAVLCVAGTLLVLA